MKNLGDLQVGDRLYEGAGNYLSRAGRLVAVMKHPLKKDVLFLLAIQRDNQFTLYQGMANGPYLSLARHIPANVFCDFCGVVSAGITIHDADDDADDNHANDPRDSLAEPDLRLKNHANIPVNASRDSSAEPESAESEPAPMGASCTTLLCLVNFGGLGHLTPPITTG